MNECSMDIHKRWALIDGVEYPITTFFDADGYETDDPYEAASCVAGVNYSDRPGYGLWFTLTIEQPAEGGWSN